jgi:hypothetical protein
LTIYDPKGSLVFNRFFTINSPYQAMDVNLSRNSGGTYRVVLSDASGKKLAVGAVVIQ